MAIQIKMAKRKVLLKYHEVTGLLTFVFYTFYRLKLVEHIINSLKRCWLTKYKKKLIILDSLCQFEILISYGNLWSCQFGLSVAFDNFLAVIHLTV